MLRTRQTNKQTDRQTDGLENSTHAPTDIVGVGKYACNRTSEIWLYIMSNVVLPSSAVRLEWSVTDSTCIVDYTGTVPQYRPTEDSIILFGLW